MSIKESLSNRLISKSRGSSTRVSEKNFSSRTTSAKTYAIVAPTADSVENIGTTSTSDIDIRQLHDLNDSPQPLTQFKLHEGVHLSSWRLAANISSKVLAEDEEYVLLECLIDKEERLYEEREFSKTLFEGFNLKVGDLFKICIYKRQNQEMIEVKDGSLLVNEDDFPKVDFFGQFEDLIL